MKTIDRDSTAARGCTGGRDGANEWARPEKSAAGFHFVVTGPKVTSHPTGRPARRGRVGHGNGRRLRATPKSSRPRPAFRATAPGYRRPAQKVPAPAGAPGSWAFRSLTTRACAATSSSLPIPVAMISAAITSFTGPRISTTSSRDSSVIGTPPPVSGSLSSAPSWGALDRSCMAPDLIPPGIRSSSTPRCLLGRGSFRGLALARGAPFLEAPHDHEERTARTARPGRSRRACR